MPETCQASGGSPRAAHLPATIALGAAGALLTFLILLGPFHAAVPTVELPAPLEPHHQTAETLLYGVAFALLLPLAAWLAPRLIDRILAGGNPGLAGPLSALTVTAAAAVLIGVRLLGPDGDRLWLGAGLALLASVVLALLWRRAAGAPWPATNRFRGRSFGSACVAGLASIGAIAAFGYPSHLDLPWLLAGLLAAGLGVFAFLRLRLPRPPRGWGLAIDLVILALVILAVPDMVVFQGVGETDQPGNPFLTYVINFHQALYLGAASQILNGSALLVDTVSQYGVASVYLLAAFFEIAPLGNGTLSFFDASLSALTFGAGYVILRLAGVGRTFATAAMVIAIVVLVWALEYPIGGLLQHGGLRFGLPVPLILFWVAAARFPRARRWLRGAGWVIVGLSPLWALEAFMYVTGALAAMLLLEATLMQEGRIRWLLRQAIYAVCAWLVALVLFALVTLAAAGSLPDWGLYITYLRDFLAGDVGDLTYDVPAFSPGLTVGFGCFLSALAVAITAIRNPGWLRERPVAALALAGLAGYGILLFSYFDNRSLAHVIPYIALPLVLSVSLWLWLVTRDRSVPRRVAATSLGAVLAVAALSVATVMPSASERAETSLLAHALPGGKSLGEGFERLWNPPELTAGAARGAALLEEYLPGQSASPVLTEPDLDNNILSLAGRANSLGITDAKEQSWVEGPHLEPVADAVAGLEAGDLMLVDRAALRAFGELGRHPDADRRTRERITAETEIADIQLLALGDIAARFELTRVARDGELMVVRLTPR